MKFKLLNNYSFNDIVLFDSNRFFSKKELIQIFEAEYSFVKNRDLVVIICENNIENYILFLALITNGAIPILVDKKYNKSWIESVIENYMPNYIFSSLELDFLTQDYKRCNLNNIYCYSGSKRADYSEKLFCLLSTSGSTGEPKLAMISKKNIFENSKGIVSYLNLTNQDSACSSLPLNYSYGLSVFLTHLFVGGKFFVTNKSVLQKEFWLNINDYKITSFNGVPFQYEIIQKLQIDLNIPHLRYLTQAGGKLHNSIILKINSQCKKFKKDFFIMYGQTECSPRISYLPPDKIEDKIGSVGKVIDKGKIDISKKFNGEGEIIYSGPNVFLGYSKNKFDLSKNLNELGSWNTGDIGFLDDEGYLYITGRSKRFIKIEGKRFNLNFIESDIFKAFNLNTYLFLKEEKLMIVLKKQEMNISEYNLIKFLQKTLNINKKSIEVKLLNEIPLKSNNKIDYNGIFEKL